MQVERQRYDVTVHHTEGGTVELSERPVGQIEKFQFGVPGDAMSRVVGGGFISTWNPDFLQRDLGRNGTCARFYFDKKMVIDIGDPETDINRRKRKLLFRHGFGYLCIPPNFSQDDAMLTSLYRTALDEYRQYEKAHPRPAVMQEAVIIDKDGVARRALMTAIDIRVGGGLTGNAETQKAELEKSAQLSKAEVKTQKNQTKFHRMLRRSVQSGTPFRNPFLPSGKRRFPIQYES